MNGRFKFSSKKMSVVLSVALAVMLVLTVSVLTIALALQSSVEPAPLPDTEDNQPQQKPSEDKAPLPGDKNDENSQKPSDDPSDDTGSGENNDNQETVVPVPDEPKWTSPVDGYVFKQHSTEELVYSLTLGDYRTHNGIDVSASAGSEVKACLDGKIEGVYYDGLMGHCVSIVHNDGVVSYYKNLGDTLPEGIAEGKEVKSGDVIGYVGESAISEFSDESHLHFELALNGESYDPLEFLEYSEKPEAPENE